MAMNTSFYISTTKVEGGVRISAEDLEKFLQIYSRKQQTHKSNCRTLYAGHKEKLNDYIDTFIRDAALGLRITGKGTRYSKGTINSIRQSLKKFKEYQIIRGVELGFEDVDMRVYRDFNAFLIEENYSINSIGKCMKNLKMVLKCAEDDGFIISQAVKGKSFKVHSVKSDAIYLTKEDLQALEDVDLSNFPATYTQARDIFMIGVWTAQRVSDYNYLSWENVYNEKITLPDSSSKQVQTIHITQQKTGKKVVIPCCSALCKILDKYSGKPLPHLYDQKINDLMKEIGRLAGLTELVEIGKTKGGIHTVRMIPKWQLIQTHTARRTGATLMYLSGMDVYDICKITGHSSIQTLERYIKAGELETVKKMTAEYEFFR